MAPEVVQIYLCSSSCFPVVSGGFKWGGGVDSLGSGCSSLFDLGLAVFRSFWIVFGLIYLVVIHCTSWLMFKRGVDLFFLKKICSCEFPRLIVICSTHLALERFVGSLHAVKVSRCSCFGPFQIGFLSFKVALLNVCCVTSSRFVGACSCFFFFFSKKVVQSVSVCFRLVQLLCVVACSQNRVLSVLFSVLVGC